MSEIPQAAVRAATTMLTRAILSLPEKDANMLPWGETIPAMVQAALDKMGIRVEERTFPSAEPMTDERHRRYVSDWLPVEPSDG